MRIEFTRPHRWSEDGNTIRTAAEGEAVDVAPAVGERLIDKGVARASAGRETKPAGGYESKPSEPAEQKDEGHALELANVRGLGLRMAQKLKNELGIVSFQDFLEACEGDESRAELLAIRGMTERKLDEYAESIHEIMLDLE